MPKLLITGSNGLLGQKLLYALKSQSDFSVVAASRNPDRFPHPGHYIFEQLDITQRQAVAACIAKHRPEVLIHTAALTTVNLCEQQKESCWDINVKGTENLIRECEKLGTHFIHLSTDFIFDGEKGPYREEDAPHPLNYYGISKLESEKILQQSKIPWSIVRTILVYGIAPQLPHSFTLFVKNSLEQKKTIRVVKDQYRTPTLAEDLAWACLEIAKRKALGVFHISGKDFVSIYEHALKIAAAFHLDSHLIEPILSESFAEPAARPRRTGFILDKARKILHYEPHSLSEGLELVARQSP